MREASSCVLAGFPLRTEVNIIRHPDRFRSSKGAEMWETVTSILDEYTDGVNLDTHVG